LQIFLAVGDFPLQLGNARLGIAQPPIAPGDGLGKLLLALVKELGVVVAAREQAL